ncbi:MAG: 50S ribosomal protein L17 [Candidatus Harrisonbacteria bacterium RIFCSPHIGHO2_01_FULL_44_13]|uniref:50S ribosomal protein L17 n=1 Tax=Candidatus Harrisonbacteria bacterium RIFCSPLOWO2_01_FULL_44_18 TaxID=1798407 RepID=A0A1G1ZMH8_9BACT|nr:MAG: 50S ribosomal protein L17 [Candidatus Harrisonbacteria bacterium RIFCSPHIGHO2_01_FULL_44_13]OGY65863.1 MAG: 50S ribosomal protein L17 [Candidatus Harrisonbacteria bacterium RIFCSPLOWO2_01_FULL_44_18]
MRKFHRKRGPRRSFLKGLANNLILKEKIETTEARAKEIRSLVEKSVTLAKKQNLAGLRLLLSRLPKDAAQKLYYDLAPRYKERKGGYLRIIKEARARKRDGAPLATIEFIR